MSNDIKRITVIEAVSPFVVSESNPEPIKKKVAAYARVSTDEEDQTNSFDNQISEYKNQIANNKQWEFAGMYADKGISGTQIKNRENFINMINDAKEGKIDLILTKSISRFGRNTVDIIQTVRELREINVAVFFEKENIYSDDPKIDFFLTIMSSIAQEESRSISSNIKWSYKKRFKEGRILLNPKNFLGYGKDENGKIYIIPEEAKVITMIFNIFTQGHTAHEIAQILMKEKIKTIRGNKKWDAQSVLRILQNEKYAGNALLQKTVTLDYLTHKRVVNDNHEAQYYVENSHPGIISNETFELVQKRIETLYANRATTRATNSKYPLTGLVYCTNCNRPMKRHIHGYGRSSERVVLNCNHAPQLKINCDRGTVRSDMVESAVLDVITTYGLDLGADEILARELTSSSNYDFIKEQMDELNKMVVKKKVEMDQLIRENLNTDSIEHNSFNIEYSKHKNELDSLTNELKELNKESLAFYSDSTKYNILKDIFEGKSILSNSVVFKTMIKIILVDAKGDLLIVLNYGTTSIDEILNDYSLLNNARLLYEKTHFDSEVNKNIRYKVVVLDE